MPRGKKARRERKKAVDAPLKKRGGGRKPSIPHAWVLGRSENYQWILKKIWGKVSGPLLVAKTKEQVVAAFQKYGRPYASEFVPGFALDILTLIHDSKFPKRAGPQIVFLAESLAGRPSVEFRTSRDICGRERKKQLARQKHRVLRKEFYMECSCGYEGPSYNRKCPMGDRKGAKIQNERLLLGASISEALGSPRRPT